MPCDDIERRVIHPRDPEAAQEFAYKLAIDVEILEVDRTRAKNYGLNLSDYSLGGLFSPETTPNATTSTTTTGGTGTTTGGGTSTAPGGLKSPLSRRSLVAFLRVAGFCRRRA